MKKILTMVLLSLPAAAQAMCSPGGGPCQSCRGGWVLASGALYAAVAVLGYWVLLQAVKETSNCVKRIGDVLGSVLVVIGLVGLLCATFSHIKDSMARSVCPAQANMPQPSHPDFMMGQMNPGQHQQQMGGMDQQQPAPEPSQPVEKKGRRSR